jgi:hypothetical protein
LPGASQDAGSIREWESYRVIIPDLTDAARAIMARFYVGNYLNGLRLGARKIGDGADSLFP